MRSPFSSVVFASVSSLQRSGGTFPKDGSCTPNVIGLNLPEGNFDLESMADDVFVFDNVVDFDRSELPPPNSADLILDPQSE